MYSEFYFTAAGTTIADFLTDSGGSFFAADIRIPNGTVGFSNQNLASDDTPVPESALIGLFGTDLVLVGLVRRKIRR